MSSPESDVGDGPEKVTDRPEKRGLVHATIEAEDGGRECTLYPAACDENEIVTRWITARDDAFVALEAAR